MKTTVVRLKGLIIGCFLITFSACKDAVTYENTAEISVTEISVDLEDSIDSVFDGWKDTSKPGVAAGIIKDGKVIYLKGFGSANLETKIPITPQTQFQLGAMSKQFTTLAILLLEKRGIILQGDDIRKHLTELPEYGHTVTIGHLLNHSSGLYDIAQINHLINGTTNIPTQVRALELIAAQKTFAFKPGTDFSYSEAITESVLMAEIVARSSGQSFADFVKTNIFEPLGMKNSLIRDDNAVRLANFAEPYEKEEEDADFSKSEVLGSVIGAINVYSTAEDLAKWYLNFKDQKSSLGRLMQKLNTPVQLPNGKKFNYYMGEMAIGREFSDPERGLPKYWNYSMQGGYGTDIFRFSEENITGFVLGNNNQYNGDLVLNALEPFLRNRYTVPSTIDFNALKTQKMSAKELHAFTGNYWFKKVGYPSRVFVKDDTLRQGWLHSARYVTLVPVADDTFQQLVMDEDIRLFEFKEEEGRKILNYFYSTSNPDVMVKYEPANPTTKSLQLYEGSFYNAAYEIQLSFHTKNDRLVATNSHHQAIEFRPIKKDVFGSTTYFLPGIEFLRDSENEIKSFTIDADGIHNLVFEKVR